MARLENIKEIKKFGIRIRRAREMLGLSQEQLATAVRITPPYVSQIESGQRIPSDEACLGIARELSDSGLDWDSLVLEAHKLRSPKETAVLFSRYGGYNRGQATSQTPKLDNCPTFQRLKRRLESGVLSSERISVLATIWLIELVLLEI